MHLSGGGREGEREGGGRRGGGAGVCLTMNQRIRGNKDIVLKVNEEDLLS